MAVYKYKKEHGKQRWYFQGYYNGVHYCRKLWEGKPMLSKMQAINAERDFLMSQDYTYNTGVSSTYLYQLYDEFVESKSLKETTKKVAQAFMNTYLSMVQNNRLDTLSVAMFTDFRKQVEKRNVSIETKNRALSTMAKLLEYGHIAYGIPTNLQVPLLTKFKDFEIKKEVKAATIYTEEQMSLFLSSFDLKRQSGIMMHTFFELIYYTGLRIGEALALTFEDYSNGKLHIYKQWQVINGKGSIVTPKSKNSVRYVTLDSKTKNDLEEYINYLKASRDYKKQNWFLFCGPTVITEQHIRRVCKEHSNKVGLPIIKIHELRHSHATYLRDMGYDEFTISQRLGNEPDTARKTYIHAHIEDDEKVAQNIKRN